MFRACNKTLTGTNRYSSSPRVVRFARVEEIFGWIKTVGLMRKTRHRGLARVGWMFTFTAAAYNLVRIRNLAEVVSKGQWKIGFQRALEPENAQPERAKSMGSNPNNSLKGSKKPG
jgi:Transposase DDE domain